MWALEVAQLLEIVDILLSSDGSSTDALFSRFYDRIIREAKVMSVLFEIQVRYISSGGRRTSNS